MLNDADLYPLLRLWLDHFLGGPSPDPTAGPPSDDDLLSYYTPERHDDSAEGYFADSPRS